MFIIEETKIILWSSKNFASEALICVRKSRNEGVLSEKIYAPSCFSSWSEIVQILNLMIDKEEYKIFIGTWLNIYQL